MRICFFGDSFVNGTGDASGLGWVGRVCASARRRGRDVTFYNLGIRRDTIPDVAARWRWEADRRLPAEVDGRLVFSFGANDCTQGPEQGRRVSPARSLVTAEAVLAEASAWLPTLVVGPCPISDCAETDGRIGELSQALGELCGRLGVPYLEVFPTLQASAAWREDAARGDGTHPDQAGYEVLAQMVAEWRAWQAWAG